MGPLRSSASFVLRAAVGCALVYLALLPLRDAIVRAIAASAGAVLWLVDRPTAISRLASAGDQVTISTHLAGVEQAIGAWNGENLPVFLVAALGLALAVPVGDQWRRVEVVLWAALAAALVTIAAAAIQLQVATVNWAGAALGLALLSPSGRMILTAASQSINVVMLLLPASILLFAYVAHRATPRHAARAAGGARRVAAPLLACGVVPAALLVLVVLRERDRDPAPALERVLALNPRAPRAFFALAAYSADAGRDRRALVLYERGLELAPDDALANFQAGNLLYGEGRFAAAAGRYRRALTTAPDDVEARYNLGNALYSAGDLAGAVRAWLDLLRRAPAHVAAHENVATALVELDRPCDALRHLERAAALPRPQPLDVERREQMATLAARCPS